MPRTHRSGFTLAGAAGLLVLLAAGLGLVMAALPQEPKAPVNPAAQRAEMIRLLRSIDGRLAAMQKNQEALLATLQAAPAATTPEKKGTKSGESGR